MITPRNIWTLCLLFLGLSVVSCVAPTRESVSRGQRLSVEEQNERTRDALKEISRLSEGSERKKIRLQMEDAYINIIKRYPESQLVHECYEKLMLIYLSEYAPPALERAELLRDEFVRRYPDSNARNLIDDTLADTYYRNAEWQKLISLYTPAIKRFIGKSEIVRPWEMFMYSEAKFHLGGMDEARKGYNIVIFYFPNSAESSVARRRLDEIAGIPRDIPAKRESEGTLNRVETIEAVPQAAPQKAEAKDRTFPEGISTSETPAPETPVPQAATFPKESTVPNTNAKGTFSLQLGFFGNERNSISLSEELKKKGYDAFILKHMSEDKKIFFRVLVGRFHEKNEAMKYAGSVLRREGMKSIIFQEK